MRERKQHKHSFYGIIEIQGILQGHQTSVEEMYKVKVGGTKTSIRSLTSRQMPFNEMVKREKQIWTGGKRKFICLKYL